MLIFHNYADSWNKLALSQLYWMFQDYEKSTEGKIVFYGSNLDKKKIA